MQVFTYYNKALLGTTPNIQPMQRCARLQQKPVRKKSVYGNSATQCRRGYGDENTCLQRLTSFNFWL
jgi:hypothetical protein